jgi:hypothetical protein
VAEDPTGSDGRSPFVSSSGALSPLEPQAVNRVTTRASGARLGSLDIVTSLSLKEEWACSFEGEARVGAFWDALSD